MRIPTAPRYLAKWTAAPGPDGKVAASVSIWAAHLRVALHLLQNRHWNQVLKMEYVAISIHRIHLAGPSMQPNTHPHIRSRTERMK